MKKISIKGTGSCVPERVIPNSYFEEMVDTTDEWIVTRTGIKARRMIEPGQALTDLATRPLNVPWKWPAFLRQKLDIIIVGTSSADLLTPSAACILQHRLGAQKCRGL